MEDDKRWACVVARDSKSNGAFFYAVKSTKCFCRPTCKARLPRRSNVEFFDTAMQAQAAGYRACKRCKPLLNTYTPEADKIRKAQDLLDSLPPNAPMLSLDRLADAAGLTKHHFHRLFKRESGMTPREYALRRRTDQDSSPIASTDTNPTTPWTMGVSMPPMGSESTIVPFDGQSDDLFGPSGFPAQGGCDPLPFYNDIDWLQFHEPVTSLPATFKYDLDMNLAGAAGVDGCLQYPSNTLYDVDLWSPDLFAQFEGLESTLSHVVG